MCADQGTTAAGALAADGKGGAWIGWAANGVHVQHITANGEFDLSPCPGIELSSVEASDIELVVDSSGGVFVAYFAYFHASDPSHRTFYYLYCQHLTASGAHAPDWPLGEGVQIAKASCCGGTFNEYLVRARLGADRSGGVVVSWDTSWSSSVCSWGALYCAGTYSSIARIGPIGTVAYRVARVGEESAIVSAADTLQVLVSRERTAPSNDEGSRILAKGVGLDGAIGWTTSLCATTGTRRLAAVAPTAGGGVAAVWTDKRSGGSDIYAGRVTGDGQIAAGWPVNGAAVCLAPGDQVQPVALALADGRLLTCWTDGRAPGSEIYGMLLQADGTTDQRWLADGTPICTASDAQTNPVIVQAERDAAIVVWQDHRCGNWDIYAQKVQLGARGAKNDAASDAGAAPRFSLGGAWPNPARGRLAVAFTLPNAGSARLEVLDVAGRKVLERELRGMSAGQHVVSLGEDLTLAHGVYAIRVRAAGQMLSKMVVVTR